MPTLEPLPLEQTVQLHLMLQLLNVHQRPRTKMMLTRLPQRRHMWNESIAPAWTTTPASVSNYALLFLFLLLNYLALSFKVLCHAFVFFLWLWTISIWLLNECGCSFYFINLHLFFFFFLNTDLFLYHFTYQDLEIFFWFGDFVKFL